MHRQILPRKSESKSTVFMPCGIQNQNQRYEVLMHFTGYEAYKGFTGV